MQSIEDLINSSQGGEVDDESSLGKFQKKEQEIKLKEEESQTKIKAGSLGVSYVDLFSFPISPEALILVNEKKARDLKVVCFFYDGEQIRVASTNPKDPQVQKILDDLCKKYHARGKMYLISKHSLDYAFKLYKNLPKIRKFINGVEIKEEDLQKFSNEITDFRSLNKIINEVSISDVVTLILATAIKTNSSDVHIEAEENGIVVRIRVDGMLQEAAQIDKEKWKKIVSRMKLLARVKINITKKPQDGRFSIFLKDEKISIRSSFLPTAFGESVVMRLLRPSSIGLPFKELGINPIAFSILEKEIKKPNGMILTTGPTGSGKTTTLYAILKKLNTEETKIITLENPVEFQIEGINQSQVEESKGYTFANGLRSILRQDPDIVMVGEIRDLETAEIATQASLTGHLVLSTLHTNDASGVIPRLIDMGVRPYFITPSINAVIGQRLVRRLCPKCRKEHLLSKEEEQKLGKIIAVISPKAGVEIPSKMPTFYTKGDGCTHCSGLGYKGRVGVYEIFTMTDDIKELTANSAPAFKILQQAIENGMLTMLQDGVLKAMDGLTSLDEVYRVIGKFDYVDALYDIVAKASMGSGFAIEEDEVKKGKELSKILNEIDDELKKVSPQELFGIIMASAVYSDAGDIHIEPTEDGVVVRYRIDGILHDIATLGKDHYIQLLSKIKSIAGIEIKVKKATIDGRFSIIVEDKKIDCRLSIISGGYGETIVVRLLINQASALDMGELGIMPYALNVVNKSIKKTKGIIVTTGPTGSGKTTTLYSILNQLNRPDVKIITIEDPIEYHLDGVMQTQINTEQGYTFASALRSLMRQNPNIIMVGEIRDNETAKVAIEAAMTGHLVLSTIHANSAAGAISRFVGLGVDRQMLANSIETTMGQRLVRKICPDCKVEDKLDEAVLSEVKKVISEINPSSGVVIPDKLKFYKGAGCTSCNGIGYKSRLGIYEIFGMSPTMQKLIQGTDTTNFDIETAAVKDGAVLMIQDGLLKALEGETSVDEVFRVAR